MVSEVPTQSDFNEAVAKNSKAAFHFHANWCSPCRVIAPKFAAEVANFSEITFFKVDVDKNVKVRYSEKVLEIPTFKFYHNGKMVDEMQGSSESQMRELLTKLNAK